MITGQVDQLMFGYRDGHQLLGGSRQVDSRALRLLLGATDMAIDVPNERFLTGLPLGTRDAYALCATWAAPEAPRPGAVWARVLLIPSELLGTIPDPLQLVLALDRPSRDDPSEFKVKLELSSLTTRDVAHPPRPLLESAVAAAYGATGKGVVVEPDLRAAEATIAALWRAQWPELRREFTFRTRPTARLDKPSADLIIARKIRGTTRPSSGSSHPAWVALVADAIDDPAQSTLRTFLDEFGPLEAPEVKSVRVLANVFRRLAEGSTDAVREALEESYPSPAEGSALKLALFGTGSARPWSGSEVDRVMSLLASKTDAWDSDALNLSTRVEALVESHGPNGVSRALGGAAPGVTEAVLSALIRRACPSDVSVFAQAHRELAVRLASAVPALLHDESAWEGLTEDAAAALLNAAGPDDPMTLTAAIHAGFSQLVRREAGALATAMAIVRTGTYRDAVLTLRDEGPAQFAAPVEDDRVHLLVVAVWGQVQSDLPDRLERTRDRVDDFWLRAAVEAIASASLDPSLVLPVAFGPLHNAITADQLPRECWRRLEKVLPAAPDPALRLRRHLLDVARTNQWTGDQFEHALRGAGPHANQLLHDFAGDDDWWLAAARAVIRTAVGLLGGHR